MTVPSDSLSYHKYKLVYLLYKIVWLHLISQEEKHSGKDENKFIPTSNYARFIKVEKNELQQ